MEESTVIQLYQFIANYTAYRHLYGHLYGHLIIALRSSHQFFTVRHPPSKIPNSCKTNLYTKRI